MALAAFILPVAMLFVITGALYTWGIKGDYETQTVVLPLKQPNSAAYTLKAWPAFALCNCTKNRCQLVFLIASLATKGSLYTWGIKGDYETQTVVLPLKQPMQQDKAWLTALAVEELNKRSLAMPSGKAKIKQAGNSSS
jgi:hypothetical protein